MKKLKVIDTIKPEIIICCYYKIENHLTHMRVLHQTIEIACSAPILVCFGRNSKSSSSPYYDHNRRTILNPILIVYLTLFHLMIAWLTSLYTITSFILTTQQLITTLIAMKPSFNPLLCSLSLFFSFFFHFFLARSLSFRQSKDCETPQHNRWFFHAHFECTR